MLPSISRAAVDLNQLQLEKAIQLLQHAGMPIVRPQAGLEVEYIQTLIDALCRVSSIDPLTGLTNRRQLLLVLERELNRVLRATEDALLLMVDIDHFKQVNDTYGHLAGDAVLCALAKALLSCVRPMDTVARYGGEEFAVVCPNCDPGYGQLVGERIRQKVAQMAVPIDSGALLQVTVSCGGAYAPKWIRSGAEAWLARADAQLYLAKAGGRNQVQIESPLHSVVSAEEKSMLFAAASDISPTSAALPTASIYLSDT